MAKKPAKKEPKGYETPLQAILTVQGVINKLPKLLTRNVPTMEYEEINYPIN